MAEYDFADEVAASENSFLVGNLDNGNLVDMLDDLKGSDKADATSNATIASETMSLFDEAVRSMEKWKKKYHEALNLAKLIPTKDGKEQKTKNFPFENASMMMLHHVFEAALDFQSRSSADLVWQDKVIASRVWGKKYQDAEMENPQEPTQDEKNKQRELVRDKEVRARRIDEVSH